MVLVFNGSQYAYMQCCLANFHVQRLTFSFLFFGGHVTGTEAPGPLSSGIVIVSDFICYLWV
jgi:hypothetical protein